MKKIIGIMMTGILLMPQLLFAGTDCWVKEFPDHYLASCVGDEKSVPGLQQKVVTPQAILPPDGQNTEKTTNRQSEQIPTAHSASTPSASTPPSSTSVKEVNLPLKEEVQEQNPALSKRNRAKIEAMQMKDMKRKAQEEIMQ
jgi:hypothetical protein